MGLAGNVRAIARDKAEYNAGTITDGGVLPIPPGVRVVKFGAAGVVTGTTDVTHSAAEGDIIRFQASSDVKLLSTALASSAYGKMHLSASNVVIQSGEWIEFKVNSSRALQQNSAFDSLQA